MKNIIADRLVPSIYGVVPEHEIVDAFTNKFGNIITVANILGQLRKDKNRIAYAKQFNLLNRMDLQKVDTISEHAHYVYNNKTYLSSFVVVNVTEGQLLDAVTKAKSVMIWGTQLLEQLNIPRSRGVMEPDVDNGLVFLVDGEPRFMVYEDILIIHEPDQEDV